MRTPDPEACSPTLRDPTGRQTVMVAVLMVFALVAVALLVGCADQKESVLHFAVSSHGEGDVPTDDVFRPAVRDTNFQIKQCAGSTAISSKLLIGEWKGYTADTFLRFDGLPDSSREVTSAELRVKWRWTPEGVSPTVIYLWALSDTSWSQYHIPCDSLFAPEDSLLDWKDFDGDVADTLTYDITDFFIEIVDSTHSAVAFKLVGEEGVECMGYCHSRESEDALSDRERPAIIYTYTEDDSSITQLIKASDDYYHLDYDTTRTTLAGEEYLTVANGFPARSLVLFSPEDTLHPQDTIHRAEVVLTVAHDMSEFDEMNLAVYRVLTEAWEDSLLYWGSPIDVVTVTPEDTLVTFSVAKIVQAWVSGTAPNYGLAIRTVSESVDISLIRLFSAEGATAGGCDQLLRTVTSSPPDFWYQRGQIVPVEGAASPREEIEPPEAGEERPPPKPGTKPTEISGEGGERK